MNFKFAPFKMVLSKLQEEEIMYITFTISNQWAVLHQVNIMTQTSELTLITSIAGSYRNVHATLNGFILGSWDRLGSIIVDDEKDIQGDESKLLPIFEKVQRAIDQKTGSATLTGKNLIIITGQ